MDTLKIKRALITVSDKQGVAELAEKLATAGVEVYSTGGTGKHLAEAGIAVQDVSAYTGFPEMMDGRLKTLHPKIFGGILFRRDRDDDQAALNEHGILPFDLVVVNLYPFQQTVSQEGVSLSDAIEKIDIGGPSLVRAAAKNFAFTTIATHPDQYAMIIEQTLDQGGTTLEFRRRLAGEAFEHTARYDRAISNYFRHLPANLKSTEAQQKKSSFAASRTIDLHHQATLRYGENPHQQAALYRLSESTGTLVDAQQLNGKELSYNNWLDLDGALRIARALPQIGAAVIKHNNPCGAASADKMEKAAKGALEGDPESAFGSIIGINGTIDVATADVLTAPGLFIEAIIATDFHPDALTILTTRPKWKNNVRLMKAGSSLQSPVNQHFRHIDGGILVQDQDDLPDETSQWQCVTDTIANDRQMDELRFAWAVVRYVKSNAILLSKNQTLCGVGAGQMSRVDSVRIAITKAGSRASGSVLASDAFFPFADSIHHAAEAGVTAIIQPGGSRRDDEVIAACNEQGIPMIFTGRRHFRH